MPFSSPGKDHLAHRLHNLGLSHRSAALTVYAVGGLAGGAALLILYVSVVQAFVLFAVATIAALVAVALLERVPFERQSPHA